MVAVQLVQRNKTKLEIQGDRLRLWFYQINFIILLKQNGEEKRSFNNGYMQTGRRINTDTERVKS